MKSDRSVQTPRQSTLDRFPSAVHCTIYRQTPHKQPLNCVQLSNSDKDHRYMATSDLLAALQQPDWRQPSTNEDCNQLCAKVVNQLDDLSGDISALAVKWCVPNLC